MKVRQIWIMVMLFIISVPVARAQSFDKLWQQVADAEKKGLPVTVTALTNDI